MGVSITELLNKKEISIGELKGKVIAIDSSLWLYQFLSSIRQRDGSLLSDSKGRTTSHLVGLFSRTTNLMQNGLKLVYVFDGEPPKLKQKERERRKKLKIYAEKKYEIAKEEKDMDEMKKYAARTSRLTSEMVEEAKKLIDALGIPIIQAPSEGEAQAAFMVKKNEAYAVASQDADCLLFGATRLVRNLSLLGKRKKANALTYETINPEIVTLADTLNNLKLDQDQLIVLGMLVGTDFNIGGIKGIGPKTALNLLRKYKSDFDALFKEVKWEDYFDYPWTEVFYLIKKIPTTNNYNLKWKNVEPEMVKKVLVDEHDFSEERVERSISQLIEKKKEKEQKGLADFF